MGEQDTSIGAGQSAFSTTQWTKIREADLQELAKTYWRPVYKFIRVAWRKSNEEAKDLTQEFFAAVFRPEFLARADPARGSFRTFVLASLKNFLRDREKYRDAAKRGGGSIAVPIEDVAEPIDESDPEAAFTRAWAESLLAESLRELERRLRDVVFRAFRESCEGASYKEIAEKLGLSVSDVTNYLHEARRELRRILESRAAEGELRELFGT